jgi:UDP-N-acetylglucosamine--N-acetylmuramyl-(pentapeptide) pyrophosphoryl-undecaprenol N-acetylglucosamine transferase
VIPSGLRILLAGGGSGGSATPVLAVAQSLRETVPNVELLYMGTVNGPEADLARAHGIQYVGVASGKLRRYWDWQNLVDPFKVLLGLGQAYRVARRFRPHAAFAAGGFGAVAPIQASWLAGARVVIHQQDVEPGLANRLLVPLARRITLTLPSSLAHFPASRSVVTGNPVRREILEADPTLVFDAFGFDHSVPLLLVTGGGTGAVGLNRLVAEAAPRLVERFQVLHLTGRGRGVEPRTTSPRYRAVEFLVAEMASAMAAATIVVSRAGMGTLAELSALGKASLIIPMPASHQWANAWAFEQLGAIEVADQDRLIPETLAFRLESLLDDAPRRQRLGEAMAASMPRDAAGRIAHEIVQQLSRPSGP